MNIIPLTIICSEPFKSFCLSVEEVTESFGTLRFKLSGKSYVFDCDYLNISFCPDSTLCFSAVLDYETFSDLHFEIYGD